ncbi:MAG: P-loop NTPase, partial [Actinobacteria bacterium]|nr:P-loop NTPase [Actinomycetota bacterium]
LITLIDKTEESIERVSRLLRNLSDLDIGQTSTSLDDLRSLMLEKIPAIVLVGPLYTLVDLENLLKTCGQGAGLVKIILFTGEQSSNIFRKAIKINIFDVLEFPFNYGDMKESISRARVAIKEITGEKDIPQTEETRAKNKISKNIMIFSSKGGTGKSFIATNLAIDLYNQTKKRVVLVDLNYQTGDIALILDIVPRHTFYDITSIINQLDTEMLSSFLTQHSSGVKILPAPVDPTQSESISTKATVKILDTLAKICDYMVIDAPSNFSENTLALLEKIDFLCMVASMDVPSIKNLKVALEVVDQLKFPEENILIIINRANTKVGITTDEIEDTLKRKIDITIPSDRLVPLTINQGNPIISVYPKSAVSKSINKLTKYLIKSK